MSFGVIPIRSIPTDSIGEVLERASAAAVLSWDAGRSAGETAAIAGTSASERNSPNVVLVFLELERGVLTGRRDMIFFKGVKQSKAQCRVPFEHRRASDLRDAAADDAALCRHRRAERFP